MGGSEGRRKSGRLMGKKEKEEEEECGAGERGGGE